MTTPFERHGFSHLSASSLNKYAVSPGLWVLERLLKYPSTVGSAAHRGTAAEAGIQAGLLDLARPLRECQDIALERFRNLSALSGDPDKEDVAKTIPGFVEQGLMALRPYGQLRLEDCQGRVELDVGLGVPLLGFWDFYWPQAGVLVDLKTKGKMASKIETAHARQVAVYTMAISENTDSRVAYVTSKKHAVYRLETPRAHLAALRSIGERLGRFLALSDDPQELARLAPPPDVDHFYCNNALTRQHVYEVFGV